MRFWHRKTDTWLIVGLGNPGEKYAQNRHNIGFMCLDRFARDHRIALERGRFHARVGEGKVAGKDVALVKPMTFMNLSGEAVGRLVRKYSVKPAQLVVVYDDLDLPLGRMRLRLGGSSGGHKGIKSIAEHTGSEEFIRLRVGIGRPGGEGQGRSSREDVIDYVLGELTPTEREVIEGIIPKVVEAIECIVTEGLTAAMNRFNSTDLRKAEK